MLQKGIFKALIIFLTCWNFASYSQILTLEKEVIFEGEVQDVVFDSQHNIEYCIIHDYKGLESVKDGIVAGYKVPLSQQHIQFDDDKKITLPLHERVFHADTSVILVSKPKYETNETTIKSYRIHEQNLRLIDSVNYDIEDTYTVLNGGKFLIRNGSTPHKIYSPSLKLLYTFKPGSGYSESVEDAKGNVLVVVSRNYLSPDLHKITLLDLEKMDIIASKELEIPGFRVFSSSLVGDRILLFLYANQSSYQKVRLLDFSFTTIWETMLKSPGRAVHFPKSNKIVIEQGYGNAKTLDFNSGVIIDSLTILNEEDKQAHKRIEVLKNVGNDVLFVGASTHQNNRERMATMHEHAELLAFSENTRESIPLDGMSQYFGVQSNQNKLITFFGNKVRVYRVHEN